jgi:phage gpG-like protein
MMLLDVALKETQKEALQAMSKESIVYFLKSFRSEAFTDETGTRRKWKKRVYTTGNKFRNTLTKTGRMRRSFRYKVSADKATVTNLADYSGFHNEGAQQRVTQKQLNYFRMRGQKATRADDKRFWFAMANKEVGDLIILPKRQFMGESKPLVNKHKKTILRILKLNTKKSRVNSVVRV